MDTRKRKEKVRKILEDCNVYNAPVPIADIAERYGFIVFETFLEDESGFLLVSNDDGIVINGKKHKKVIAVNSVDTPFRKRFTIAHELGHYFLEVFDKEENLPKEYYVHRELFNHNKQREKDADKFAAELLMPTHFLEYELNRLNKLDLILTDLPQYISGKFQVSYSAARLRLAELERRF